MGDDYDILCVNMLEELNYILTEEDWKAPKTIKVLKQRLAEWNRRRKDFEQYRKVVNA